MMICVMFTSAEVAACPSTRQIVLNTAVSRKSKWTHNSQSSAEVKAIPAAGFGSSEYQTFLETVCIY